MPTHNPSPGEHGDRGGGLDQTKAAMLPFLLAKKKELMQVHCWERRKTGLILFCYLPKLSLIPLILLELIWLKSLSPGSMPFAIFWDFFSNHPDIERGGEAKGREEKGRQEVGRLKKTSIKQCCCPKSETHLFPFGAHMCF